MSTRSHHVFFDPTGHRWRWVKAVVVSGLTLLCLALAASWGPVHRAPPLGAHGHPLPQPNLTGLGRPRVVGTGPLVRLVKLDWSSGQPVAVDPFTGQRLAPLTGGDANAVQGQRFAIQHYGYSSAAHKTISLTFDDGPDPAWTPQILDILAKYHAPATFFVIGSEAVAHPELIAREAREGHTVANHTMTHPALTSSEVPRELVPTDRVITAETGTRTNLARLPYDGSTAGIPDNGASSLAAVQRLHYVVSMEDFDTNDWKYGDPKLRPDHPIPLPPTSMDNITMLLHDGGGDRSHTIAYLQRLLPWALAHGYHFHSLPQVSPDIQVAKAGAMQNVWDHETLWAYQSVWTWPTQVLRILFQIAIATVVGIGLINVLLAAGRHIRRARAVRTRPAYVTGPPVTVLVPAYNEEKVIGRTLAAISRSTYTNLTEVVVVDDGSSDGTADAVDRATERDPRIRLVRQENAGKAAALNRGFAQAMSDIVVTLDADTVIAPTTVGSLARPFGEGSQAQEGQPKWNRARHIRPRHAPPRLGVVAGVVKVGNLRNLLTRWQALEYITQIGVDRGAQAAVRGIMVVPGACAAWSRDAVLSVGGYSPTTLTEDCDLALELQHRGYMVHQEDDAICYTEAPENPRALTRQRFRWMYGNLQALWKHRSMILNPEYRWLGMVTMPWAVMSVLLPVIFLPFIYAMLVVAIINHGLLLLLLYTLVFLVAQFAIALAGIWLTHERPVHLLIVPIYRLVYEPLRTYLVYKAALTVLRGSRSGWNKLQRTGTVDASAVGRVGARL